MSSEPDTPVGESVIACHLLNTVLTIFLSSGNVGLVRGCQKVSRDGVSRTSLHPLPQKYPTQSAPRAAYWPPFCVAPSPYDKESCGRMGPQASKLAG